MKRSAPNDELPSIDLVGKRLISNEKAASPCKKLKFGVDTILGNIRTHSHNESSFETGNDSDDELRHKGKTFISICTKGWVLLKVKLT